MAHCNPAPTEPFSCPIELRRLYDRYMAIISGSNLVEMQSSDYQRVQYGPGNVDQLLKQYALLWNMCGPESGLPNIAAASGQSLTRRGGPANIRGCSR